MRTDDLLAADTRMGTVTLLVSDLDAMTRWYRDAVLLDVISAAGPTVSLGRGATPFVVLEHAPDLTHAAQRSAGLFHTAILFPTRASLAASVYSIATATPGAFTGSADHLVSEAFYFDDPEGNGVELYFDRARSDWTWTDGQIQMATLPLDPTAYLGANLREGASASAGSASTVSAGAGSANAGSASTVSAGAGIAAAAGATVGHVHLRVGDITTAREFYVDRLGFEATVQFGDQALFVSAGGYHHHMAMNTWNSRGAGPRTRALGLGVVNIVVPDAEGLGAVGERLTRFGHEVSHDGQTLSFDDPWRNLIRVTSTT
ncbi:MAG: VOC family protein [Microbacteriaceae bacterium]|nr:VOC family protein [Microbacteriaceae bacterium]